MVDEDEARRGRRPEHDARERYAPPTALARPTRRDDAVGDERDGGQHRGDEPPVEIRERDRRGGGDQERTAREIGTVDAAPQGPEVEREPLRLRDVWMAGGLRDVERKERVGQPGDHRPEMGFDETARQQVGGGRREGKGGEDQDVVGRDGAHEPGQHAAREVGERLQVR